MKPTVLQSTREQLIHSLYEAAELEHSLMCTYLYAAFSLRSGVEEGLTEQEALTVEGWRRDMLHIAIEEMGHLTAVWNITSALGGSPRFGRGNFPLDPGILPAGVVVKLAPFSEAVLQHFVHLERPNESQELDGHDFASPFPYRRSAHRASLTPMAVDYETVGAFYAALGEGLRQLVMRVGERAAFCGDPALQLSEAEVRMSGAAPVTCLKTALQAFDAIVHQGEGAPRDASDSHFRRFLRIRGEYRTLRERNKAFEPAFPAACNPLLRPPVRSEGRVFIEDDDAAAVVDLANTGYALMLRLLAYSYVVPRPRPDKALAIDLALGLMRAVTCLAERAARMPVGPGHPGCNAGMSFTALRDSSPFPEGEAAGRFFVERLQELADASRELAGQTDRRVGEACRRLRDLATQGAAGFAVGRGTRRLEVLQSMLEPAVAPLDEASAETSGEAAAPQDGVEWVEGRHLTVLFEGRRCIHARHCVTQAPKVFLANVEGPWIHPDAMDHEALIAVAEACPSGAIRYRRKNGRPEPLPPVNLLAVREGGPYALRGDLRMDGRALAPRATLCRCGASRHKPFCDGSHRDVGFAASGEPPTEVAEVLPARDGPLAISLEYDGPLQLRGNLEIVSGTGRMVTRCVSARLCRCGASGRKPFCDGSHARIGFKSG